MDRLRFFHLFCCAILILVTTGTYINVRHGAFQYDDFYTILINPHLDKWVTFVGHLDHMVRPLLYATFRFDRSVFGNNPAGYHLLNLLLHLGSGLLVYRIVGGTVTEKTRHVPFWTALFFLIHPLQTETVTYISGRASGLMAFFYLLAFFFFLKASDSALDGILRRLYMLGAVASFLLALGSKETAMTFPVVLLLWELLIRRLRGPSLHTALLSYHLPFWLLLLVVAGWAWSHPRYAELAQFSLQLRPLWDHLLSEAHAVTYSLMLFFCPWKQSFDHDLPEFQSLLQWPLPLDLLVLGGLAMAAALALTRFPLFAFGIGWLFIQLLPTGLIPRNDLLSERNLYLPSIGLLLAVAVLGSHLTQWLTKIFPRPWVIPLGANGLAAFLVLALCMFTYERNILYSDPVLLWSDAIEKSPRKARPHNNLGHAYAMRDDWERALEEFRIAVQLDPDYALAKKNLRDAYLHQVGRL